MPLKSFLGSVTFYTTLPLPPAWELEFNRIARWAPIIGLLLGGLLGLLDLALELVGMPVLTRSALLVGIWVVLTGGLHLDGVMDTADGLAVTDETKRLEVMKDSLTGAFGVMAAAILLLLKTVALSELHALRPIGLTVGLMLAAGWGRWGQVAAIAFYPYLRATGKGGLHKENLRSPDDIILGLFFLLLLAGIYLFIDYQTWWIAVFCVVGGGAIALFTGFWFYRKLGGHTGDTYGAIVEWTEALFLCFLTILA